MAHPTSDVTKLYCHSKYRMSHIYNYMRKPILIIRNCPIRHRPEADNSSFKTHHSKHHLARQSAFTHDVQSAETALCRHVACHEASVNGIDAVSR